MFRVRPFLQRIGMSILIAYAVVSLAFRWRLAGLAPSFERLDRLLVFEVLFALGFSSPNTEEMLSFHFTHLADDLPQLSTSLQEENKALQKLFFSFHQ